MSYSSEVLADSPALYLRLNESSGTSAADSSGNGRTLTSTAAPTWGAPSLLASTSDTAATITSGAQALVRAAESWMFTDDYTVEAWIKTTSDNVIVASIDDVASGFGSARRRFLFGLGGSTYGTTSGAIMMWVYVNGYNSSIYGGPAINDGQPHHIVAVIDTTVTQTVKLYVDGALAASTSTAGPVITGSLSDRPLAVGTTFNGSTSNYFTPFNGAVDEFAFYSYALPVSRVTAHYTAGITAASATGTIAGALGKVTGSLTGAVTDRGAIGGTLPALTGSLTATTPRTGAIAGTLPKITGSLNSTGIPTDGDIAGTLPAITGSLGAKVTARGDIAGSLPAVTGALTGDAGTSVTYPVLPATSTRTVAASLVESQVSANGDLPILAAASTREVGGRAILQPIAPPSVIFEWPVQRQAHLMPALSAATPKMRVGNPANPGEYAVDCTGRSLRRHVFIDGVDCTYLRDVPASFETYAASSPFNATDATVGLPQLRPWDIPGTGDLAMLDMSRDPAVEIVHVYSDGEVRHVWEGNGATDEDASGQGREDYTFRAEGLFMQAANEIHGPPLFMEPTDRGHAIADVLNSVTARRWSTIPRLTTGLTTQDRGQTGESKWSYVQRLLSGTLDDDGRQLTLRRVAAYTYRLAWKTLPTDANVNFTVTKGAPGVECDFTVDQSQRRDCIYGRGVDPDGGMWGNWFFPFLDLFVPPRYPMDNTSINLDGRSDATTDTGNGITTWQRRMVELGYRVTVDGVMNPADATYVRQIQRARGITADGSLGPQTWAATFDKGAPTADLRAIRRPLATLPEVEPYLYTASGAIAGPNPAWDRKKIRHAMPEVDFGTGIYKRDAIALAQKMLTRDSVPAITGTITLTTDPHEAGTSRFDIQPGDNIKVIGHRGGVVVQVVDVSVNGLTVTLNVDSKARDTLALEALLERNREARRDPSASPRRSNDTATLNTSEVVPYESESKAGQYPRTAINGDTGLWTVIPIFVSQIGVAKIDFRTDHPAAEMWIGLFERPVTANFCAARIGNPSASVAGVLDNIDELKAKFGLLEFYGTPDSPGGYWPRQKGQGPLTGRLVDTSGALYGSKFGGVIWVAAFTSRSTWLSGRVYPAGRQ